MSEFGLSRLSYFFDFVNGLRIKGVVLLILDAGDVKADLDVRNVLLWRVLNNFLFGLSLLGYSLLAPDIPARVAVGILVANVSRLAKLLDPLLLLPFLESHQILLFNNSGPS